MADSWNKDKPKRDVTIAYGEDLDLGGKFVRDKLPWIPPEGTEVYFRAFRTDEHGGELDIPCVINNDIFSVHIESEVCDTFTSRMSFWFYVKTPETPAGNPKVITIGVVKRVEPA